MAERIIAAGGWVQVRVLDVDGQWKGIGLAQGCSYNEDYGVQPANVMNHIGPVSYDAQNYSCRVSLSTFVPNRKVLTSILPDGGEITIEDLLPLRDEIQASGRGKMFDGLQFANTSTSAIIRQFQDLIVGSNGQQVSPTNYLSEDIQFFAIKRVV